MSNITNVGVQFTVTSNLSALTAEVNALNAKLAQHLALMSKMEDRAAFTQQLVAGYKNAADASGLFNTQLVNLGTQVDQLGRRIERNQLKLSEYRRYIREARKGVAGDVMELAKSQARMRSSMILDAGDGKFMVSTAKGVDMVAQKHQVLNEKVRVQNTLIRQGNEAWINWGKNTQWAGRQLTVGLTIPMGIFGALASKVFRDADKELTRLQKVYGDGITKPTANEIKKIRSDVLEISKTISETRGGNLNEIISTGADIAATGKTGIELIKTLDETTRFQTLGEIDRQTAIKSTLALQTAFKQNTTELRQSINFLNAAENSTSLSMEDMAEAIPRAGTVVKGLGGNIEDLTLYMVAMREGGIDAAEGANALKSGLASIINPSTKAKKILSEYGIDIESIVETNKGQLTPTILALKKELDGLDGLARSRSITALFGKYQFARMSALFNNINSEGSQTNQILKLIGASAAELEDVAVREEKTITESLSKRWETAINRVKNAMIPIGETFTKIAIPLINVAAKILEVFNALPSAMKSAAVALAAIAAIAGPVIMTMGIMANLFGQLKQGWRGMTGFGLKLMGRERQEMGPLLTPEIVAHQEALKKDSTSIIAHSETLDAARAQLRALGSDLIDNSRAPRLRGSEAPVFEGSRYPTLTKTRVDSARTNEQMAVQLMGDSLTGRPMVGGLLSANPTGGNVGLVPAHYRWLESQDLKYASAAIAGLDQTMATQLLQIDEAVRRSKFGDGFAAYSHLYAEEGSTPLGSFVEWQKPNNARQGDVRPGELPETFVAGQKQAMASLLAGGGQALYDEASKNPQLRRALQFHIAAMEASKKEFEGRNSEEFTRLMRAMAGESAEAMEETRRRIVAIGDQWKTQASAQLALAGVNPSTMPLPAPSERGSTTPRSLETTGPSYRPGVAQSDVINTSTKRTYMPLLQRQWTEGLKKAIGDMEIHSFRVREMTTASGQTVKVFDLIDINGRLLATAQKTLTGRLGLAAPVAAQLAVATTGLRSAFSESQVATEDDIRKTQMKARANERLAQQAEALARRMAADSAKAWAANPARGGALPGTIVPMGSGDVRDAINSSASLSGMPGRGRREGLGRGRIRPMPVVTPLAPSDASLIKSQIQDIDGSLTATRLSAEQAAEKTALMGRRFVSATSSLGILASTMLVFAGNTQSAVVQIAFMATTLMSMVPLMGALVPQFVRLRATNFAQSAMTSVTGLITRVKSAIPALGMVGKGMASAMFGPWGIAAAAAGLAIAFFIKKNKDGYEKARQDAVNYANAVKMATVEVGFGDSARELFKIKREANAVTDTWKQYSVRMGDAAVTTKSFTEQVKEQYENVIEGLKGLNPDDLANRLESIYKNLVISGASEEQAQQFLDALGEILDKRSVTVNVVGRLKGWGGDQDPSKMLADSFSTALTNSPDMVDVSNSTAKQIWIRFGLAMAGQIPTDGTLAGRFLQEEFGQAVPKFEAFGQGLGSTVAVGIQEGIITADNGELGKYLAQGAKKIVDDAATQVDADGTLQELFELDPQGIQKVFNDAGVPVEKGFQGLFDKLQNSDKATREGILNSLVGLGDAGRELELGLRLAMSGTEAFADEIIKANPSLAQQVGLLQGGEDGLLKYGAAAKFAGESMANITTAGDNLNDVFRQQEEAAKKDFFALAKKNIDNYADRVRERNAQMVENARESARAQVEAVRNAEKDKLDALKKAQDKRQKQMEDKIERTRKQYDSEIEAIQKAEDARKKAFEAEKERIRRLTEQRNFNIDYDKAVAEGDLFGAARIRNEQDAAKKNYAIEDKNSTAEDAVDKRIKKIELERDKKIAAQEAALEKQKEADEKSIESAQKASDARVAAAEKAADVSIKAAERTADRSNKAAKSAVEGQRKIMTEAQAAWDAAQARGESGVAVALTWGPKLGIPAEKARQIFESNYNKYPGIVAGGLNKAATDPKVAKAARAIAVTTIAGSLGLVLSKKEREMLINNPGLNLGDYYAARLGGASAGQIATGLALGVPLGGPESRNIPGRQVGGKVYKGMPYVVGETGHELFVPQQSGTIVNSRDFKKMGRDGGMGGTEGLAYALGVGLATMTAKSVAGRMAKAIKNRPFGASSSGVYAGPVTEGNGIFDGGFSYPFGGRFRVSSPFGWRNSPHGYGRMFHSGTDIAAPMGTPIKAIGGGIVQAVGWDPAKDPRGRPWLGQRTIINHGNGWQSYYGHQSEYMVKEGQRVSEGQRIGLVGSTGASTGPHLHLTIKNGGKLVNPSMVIPGLAKGAKINYDNTIANLHKGEAVLTAPITSKFEQLANQMSYNTGYGDIKVIFTGPVNSEVDVEAGVTAALNKRDLKMGKGRKID